MVNPVIGDAVDVQVAIGRRRAAIGVIEEIHRNGMRASAPCALQGERVRLVGRMQRLGGEHPTDLHAIHLDGVLRVAVPGILADAQHQRVGTGAGGQAHRLLRRGGGRGGGRGRAGRGRGQAEILRPAAVHPPREFRMVDPVIGHAVDEQVAVGGSRPAIGVVEEVDRDRMRAAAPGALQRHRVGLVQRMQRLGGEGPADLHAIHPDSVLGIAVPGLLTDPQHQRVRPGPRGQAHRLVGGCGRDRSGNRRGRAHRARDLDDHGMVGDIDIDGTDIGEGPDGRGAQQRVEDLDLLEGLGEADLLAGRRDVDRLVGGFVPDVGLGPGDDLPGAVALLRQQGVAGGRRVGHREVQRLRGEGLGGAADVGQDGGQVVDGGGGRLGRLVQPEQAEILLLARAGIGVEQLVDVDLVRAQQHAVHVGVQHKLRLGGLAHALPAVGGVDLRVVAGFGDVEWLSRVDRLLRSHVVDQCGVGLVALLRIGMDGARVRRARVVRVVGEAGDGNVAQQRVCLHGIEQVAHIRLGRGRAGQPLVGDGPVVDLVGPFDCGDGTGIGLLDGVDARDGGDRVDPAIGVEGEVDAGRCRLADMSLPIGIGSRVGRVVTDVVDTQVPQCIQDRT